MTPIDNSGFLNVCGNCDCPGFVPAVSFSWNAGTKVLTVTDASTFPAGDGLKAINITVSDTQGNTKTGRIAVAAGNVAIDLSSGMSLGVSGINIMATAVTTHRCVANLSVYNVAIPANTTGTLGNKVNEGDIDGAES